MKLISLIRHAKSSWKDSQLSDFDRPLNKRGQRDAPRMGRRLAAVEPLPDLILSSPAMRAARTAQVIAEAIGYASERIEFQRTLYLATPGVMLGVIQDLDDRLAHVALVAHNPGLTDLCDTLAHARINNVPTCGIVRIQLEIDSWRNASSGCGTLLEFDYPKRDEHRSAAGST
jgi:phosphohistidine phosphatase